MNTPDSAFFSDFQPTPEAPLPDEELTPAALRLKAWLLLTWLVLTVGLCYFAGDLQMVVAGWPLHYWLAAQGLVLVFLAVVAVYALVMNRQTRPRQPPGAP